jgi:hypothetical protein
VPVLLAPPQPRGGHGFKVSNILWSDGVCPGNTLERPKPVSWFITKPVQQGGENLWSHLDDPLVGGVEDICHGGVLSLLRPSSRAALELGKNPAGGLLLQLYFHKPISSRASKSSTRFSSSSLMLRVLF